MQILFYVSATVTANIFYIEHPTIEEFYMCSPYVRKEANRLNWIIKGKLIDKSWSDETVEQTYHSYFARLWGNNECYIHEAGFERAWKERETEMFDEDIQRVAILGGHYD
jgi:hypothetical protein